MRHFRPRLLLGALLVALLLPVSLAQANAGTQIIHRCEFGQGSLAGFSQAAYNQALADLNGSAAEYSDCADLIREAQKAALRGALIGGHPAVSSGPGGIHIGVGGGHSGGPSSPDGGSSGATNGSRPLSTAAENQILAASRDGSQLLAIGGLRKVRPGASSSVSAPLIVVLVALLVGGLVVGGTVMRRRVRTRRSS